MHDYQSLPVLLRPEEVATLLRTTRKAVYLLAQRGLLPGVKRVGRRLLIERGPLLEWLREGRAPSPSEKRR